MILEQQVLVEAPIERVWAFMMDIPRVSTCVPGVSAIEMVDADTYDGEMAVKVGPIGVRLSGRITVAERDPVARRSRLDIVARDARLGSTVKAQATMTLRADGETGTRIDIHTDASILGKLGDFGLPVVRRKADRVIAEFAGNMSRQLRSTQS